jgi:membrane protease YdiL (CAAX protease family)
VITWFTPLYLLGIYGVVRYFSKPTPTEEPNKISWKPLEAIGVTLAIYFVAQLVGGVIVYAVPAAFGWSSSHISHWLEHAVLGQFALITVVESFTLWFLYVFLKRRKTNFKALGLKDPRLTDIGYAAAGFLVYFVLYLAVVSIAKTLVPGLNVGQQQQVGFDNATHWQLPLVFISLVILPPVVEELLVRGFLYSGLKKSLPKVWAVLIASGLFAVAHLQAGSGEPLLWIAAIDTFVLSLVLIYLRDKTGRLWASIGLHMLKNFVAFLALFVFVGR